ncbi:MAG: DUF6588 family protein [Bacteroidales bacterium]
MKRIFQRLILAAILHWTILCSVQSQRTRLDFIYGGVEDAEQILHEYLEPYARIIGSDLSAGWYNTARPHKLGGLSVTASISWARAPVSALTYDISDLDLNGTIDPVTTEAPTIAGRQEERPVVTYTETVGTGEEKEYAVFELPDGSGMDFFPLPMGQITVGLPLGTDVSARFVPMIGLSDYGEIGLWGVGGMHSLSQWLPFIKRLRFLDVGLQGGYTRVTSSLHVLVEPQEIVEVNPQPMFNWDDQFVVQKVEGWTVNLIASQTLPVVTFYQGIGYASSLVEVMAEGHYPVQTVIESEGEWKITYEIVNDPVAMKYENFNNLRINAGARIKLGVFTFHYDFTHTCYPTHTVGIGFSFREEPGIYDKYYR